MKKLLLLLLLSVPACGQTLTRDELIAKSKCTDFACISDFLLTKGFSFLNNKTDPSYTMIMFRSDKFFPNSSNPKLEGPNTVTHVYFKTGNEIWLSITTTQKDYFQALKVSFAQLGFVQKETENREDETTLGHIVVHYLSPKYPTLKLQLHTVRRENQDGQWTAYDIEVRRRL